MSGAVSVQPLPARLRAAAAMRRVLGGTGMRVLYGSALAAPLRRALAAAAPPGMPLVEICGGELTGTRMHLDLTCEKYYWLGTHEESVQRAMCASVTADGVVYDVGAHAGFFTLLASKLVGPDGRVVAFEPLPANAARLRVNLAANGRMNVDVMEAAASDARGEAWFNIRESSLEGALSGSGDARVRTVTIDDVVRAGARVPELIKIDVEGAEGAVLRGTADTIRNFRPRLLVEVHSERAGQEVADALPVPYAFRDIRTGALSAGAPGEGHYLGTAIEKKES